MEKPNKKYIFVGKCLFFPKEGILAVGDLHLGYEEALRQKGLEVPLRQSEEAAEDLGKIIMNIRARFGKIEQIIFLGDIRHHFSYQAGEKEEIKKLLSFLRKEGIEENRVIFIRGNHEKNDRNGKYLDYYIAKDIAFTHGDKDFLELHDRAINLIVMGHIHPTIVLRDRMAVKSERYKCFLAGKHKKKECIILPSFINITEGVSLSEFADEKGYDFSLIPNKELEEFNVIVVPDVGEEALEFGKLKKMRG